MDNRQKIVTSAKEMFWRHGYSTTSPRQVMEASGVGQGSYYHHFPAKTDLAREVVVANGRDLLEKTHAAMRDLPTGRERLAGVLSLAGDALAGCRVGGFTYDAGMLAEPELREAIGSVFAALAEVVEEAVRDGKVDGSLSSELVPEETAAMLLAVLQGVFVLARATGSQKSADAAVAGALALLTPQL